MRGHRDLEWVSVAAVACAVIAALVPLELIRLVAALPLTLFLPGYALVAAAFASRELAPPKRLTLSVGTSLMVLVLGAFVLNVFPFGLTTASWAVLLPMVVIAACRAAAIRRDRPARRRSRRSPLPRPQPGSIALVSIALLIGAGALALAQKPLPAEDAEGYAALWMLPADAEEETAVVGVINNEHDPASYRLKVRLGEDKRARTYRVELDPGEERTYEIGVARGASGRTHVVASLYREEQPTHLYRRVTSWLPRQKTFP
ncbi:MAG TPA: DUF1616 domain-containing protein [Solirubrobacterales bacterium]|nr:DUF1616 domain-containing protein [Solirubrobacterales bacterium]